MIYLIKKGKHSISKRFALIKFWVGPKRLIYRVRFDSTWKQSWPGEDMADVSKLIGIGCLNLAYLLKLKAPHHWKGTRLGIDYNESLDVIDAYEYIYNRGVRFFKKVFEFQFDEYYIIDVVKTPDKTTINICDMNFDTLASFDGPSWRGISYLLRPYYGGNNPARIDTNVNLKRL
jgi:hypothetical protein